MGANETAVDDEVPANAAPSSWPDPATPRSALVRQIAFLLSDLPSENAAHRFEDLCRQVARERVAANVVPATGPVGAGGDQGRDFETYRTYLAEQLGRHGGFTALVPNGAIAFACTLQQDDVPTKIRRDVRTICTGGVAVESIYCFVVVPVPVGVRHGLQAELRERHSVHVEIFDRNWLSETLATPELFWIAEEHLSVPAAMAPARAADPASSDELAAWYEADRERWRRRRTVRPTLGELLDVRDGLRYATFNLQARGDLPFWLELIEPLCATESRIVRQRARYEAIAARIRGLKDLRPSDGQVAAYFEEAAVEADPARLSDAGVLLTYASIAYAFAQSELELEQLQNWRTMLCDRVEQLLDEGPPPVLRARLLEVLGQLCLARDASSLGRASTPIALPEVTELVDGEGRPMQPFATSAANAEMFSDLERGLEAWSELADRLAELPLFPVDALAHTVNLFNPLLAGQDRWAAIVQRVDDAVARAEGDASAGNRGLDRALALIDAGRLLAALEELHSAKTRFFHGDHARSFISILLALGDIYAKLNLPTAARQYALAAAKAAHESRSDEVSELLAHALFAASQHDYRAGNFATALQTMRVAVIAHRALVDSDGDQWSERDLADALLTGAVCFTAAHELLPDLVGTAVDGLLASIGVLEHVIGVLGKTDGPAVSAWTMTAKDESKRRGFADLGDRRELRFSANGLEWKITCANTYAQVAAAERLAAAAQVLAAELASVDLVLLPSTVQIETSLRAEDSQLALRRDRDGVWHVGLLAVDARGTLDHDGVIKELLAILVQILSEASLLDGDRFTAAIADLMAGEIAHKLCPVRPFDELVPYSERHFEVLPVRACSHASWADRPPARCHPLLQMPSTPGPGYTKAVAEEILETRYRQLSELMPVTLGALRNDRRFAATVAILRQRGWLDWHILTAVYNIVFQSRLQRAELTTAGAVVTAEGQAEAQRLVFTPEAVDDPPVSLSRMLDVRRLDVARAGAIPSLLARWGLNVEGRRSDVASAERLLAARYGYWEDDIDHVDPFST